MVRYSKPANKTILPRRERLARGPYLPMEKESPRKLGLVLLPPLDCVFLEGKQNCSYSFLYF